MRPDPTKRALGGTYFEQCGVDRPMRWSALELLGLLIAIKAVMTVVVVGYVSLP